MLKRTDIDFVVVATPWTWHAPMALVAMKEGKDVAIEVRVLRQLKSVGISSHIGTNGQALHYAGELLLWLQ